MRRCGRLLLVLGSAVVLLAAEPIGPSAFRYNRDLAGPFSPGTVYRVLLPGDILHRARPDRGDIRLFDGDGAPVPAVSFPIHQPPRPVRTVRYRPTAYRETSGMIHITVETEPIPEAPVTELVLTTPNRDFEAVVTIREPGHPEPIGHGPIFDYSSRVQLRRTSVPVQPTRSRQLDITIQPEPGPETDPSQPLELTYRDLTFRTGERTRKPLTFTAFTGQATGGESVPGAADVRYVELTDVAPQEKKGRTVFRFETGVPLTSIGIQTGTPYFYRDVQVSLQRPSDGNLARVVARGAIYRFPTGAGPVEKLDVPVHGPLSGTVRFTILNQDSPPLQIDAIRLAHPEVALFFIPDRATDRMVLAYGQPALRPAAVDIRRVIRPDNWRETGAIDVTPGPVRVNTGAAATPAPDADWMNRLLPVVVLLVVVLLALWTRRLLQESAD